MEANTKYAAGSMVIEIRNGYSGNVEELCYPLEFIGANLDPLNPDAGERVQGWMDAMGRGETVDVGGGAAPWTKLRAVEVKGGGR